MDIQILETPNGKYHRVGKEIFIEEKDSRGERKLRFVGRLSETNKLTIDVGVL
jgi:hypothetical protein